MTAPPLRVDAPVEKLRRLQELRRKVASLQELDNARYRTDPVAWARERLGVHLWSKQRELAMSVVNNRRTAVRSSHGVGKSFLAAVLACWWIDVHPPGTAMVISTAPSHDQVHGVLWENIRALHSRGNLPGTVQRSDRWLDDQGRLVGMGRRPPDHADSAFQGYHREHILVILDEAGGIPAWLWTATEAVTTGAKCRVFAVGNPTDNSSNFAQLRNSPIWATDRITTFDTPNFTGEIEDFPPEIRETARHEFPSREWQRDALRDWGEHSSLYQVRVMGEFADRDDGLVPLSWVAQANVRWNAWHDKGEPEVGGPRIISCDVAWLGEDMTAIAVREADVIRRVHRYAKMDTVQTTALVEAELEFPASKAIVDVVGVGAGVVDQLRAHRRPVTPFNGSAASTRRDVTGQWRFVNRRVEALYNLRELLDPSKGATLALPADDTLTADITTPTYGPRTGGKIWVESKDEIRKRLARSPDVGDAVAMAMWLNPTSGRGDWEERRSRRARAVAHAGAQFTGSW